MDAFSWLFLAVFFLQNRSWKNSRTIISDVKLSELLEFVIIITQKCDPKKLFTFKSLCLLIYLKKKKKLFHSKIFFYRYFHIGWEYLCGVKILRPWTLNFKMYGWIFWNSRWRHSTWRLEAKNFRFFRTKQFPLMSCPGKLAIEIFWGAVYESVVKFTEFKMVDPTWRTKILKILQFL